MGALLNLVGLSTAVVLYTTLLFMVVQVGRRPRGPARIDPLLLATAVLGLVWNLSALPAYALPTLGIERRLSLLTLVGTSALGFLPAVVVHSVLRGEHVNRRRETARMLLASAYGASTTAALLHTYSLATGGPLPSHLAMQILTFVFIALLLPVALVTRGQHGLRRALWIAALSAFAVSALHLSQSDRPNPPWAIELVGHHASLPLAIAILYQDFPFALADLFLKRALTVVAAVAAALTTLALLGGRTSALLSLPLGDPRVMTLLVVLWTATLVLYPYLRRLSNWFVDAIVLKRPDYASLRADISRRAQRSDDVPSILDAACAQLGPALNAKVVRWRETPDAHPGHVDRRHGTGDVSVSVPVAEPPHYLLEVSEFTGGRRLLSDDQAFLDQVSLALGRRIDAIRITRERYARKLREQEIAKLATEAELRALRAQINPHFLFNALTTVGYLIQTSPTRALRTLMRLTALLRGVLRSDGELTTLDRELDLIESYLDIERARFEERLRVHIDVPARLRLARIPPLLLQPLVENAVKHGIAERVQGGEITITARQDGDARLILTVRDTGAGATVADLRRGREDGVGLHNIERRLASQYGTTAGLALESEPGVGTTVEVRMPAEFAVPLAVDSKQSA